MNDENSNPETKKVMAYLFSRKEFLGKREVEVRINLTPKPIGTPSRFGKKA